jgi:hypothetical protein
MALTAKKSGQMFDPVSQGLHHAVCYAVYDLGTQYNEKFSKYVRKILIGWEIPSERITVERDNEKVDLPRAISKSYTNSLHEKAQLRKDLESWRGRAFSEHELEGFDILKLLGANCMIQVIHKKKDDKVYANVANIVSLPKGMERKEPENPNKWFSFEEGMDIPEHTPQWIIDIIKASQEWQTSQGGGMPEQDAPPVDDGLGDVDTSDIPF